MENMDENRTKETISLKEIGVMKQDCITTKSSAKDIRRYTTESA